MEAELQAQRNRAIAKMIFGWTFASPPGGGAGRTWHTADGEAKASPPDFGGDDRAFGQLLDKMAELGTPAAIDYNLSRGEWTAAVGEYRRYGLDRRAVLVAAVLAFQGRREGGP